MTDEELKRANVLNESLTHIKDLRRVFSTPNPTVSLWNRIVSACTPTRHIYVDFVTLDPQTYEEVTKTVIEVLDRRYKEIQDELQSM